MRISLLLVCLCHCAYQCVYKSGFTTLFDFSRSSHLSIALHGMTLRSLTLTQDSALYTQLLDFCTLGCCAVVVLCNMIFFTPTAIPILMTMGSALLILTEYE